MSFEQNYENQVELDRNVNQDRLDYTTQKKSQIFHELTQINFSCK